MRIDKTIRNITIYASLFVVLLVILLIFPFIDNTLILQLSNIQNPILNPIMLWISNIGSGIVVFFIVTTLFLYEERKRKWIIPLWLGFALSSIIVFLLKLILLKDRPFMILDLFAFKEFAFWNSSFPSWHAAMAFSALPVIDKEFPKIRIVWILFAILILFSRVYFAYHFFSDIIAGALIGYFSGFIFVRLWEKKIKTKK